MQFLEYLKNGFKWDCFQILNFIQPCVQWMQNPISLQTQYFISPNCFLLMHFLYNIKCVLWVLFWHWQYTAHKLVRNVRQETQRQKIFILFWGNFWILDILWLCELLLFMCSFHLTSDYFESNKSRLDIKLFMLIAFCLHRLVNTYFGKSNLLILYQSWYLELMRIRISIQNQNLVLFVSNQLNTISLAIENYAIF